MLRSFSDGLGRVVRRKPWSAPAPQKPASRPASISPTPEPQTSADVFDHDLDALLNRRSATKLVGGALEFDGLESLQGLLATAWPNLASRLREIAESEFRAYLQEGDVYRVHENATVLLCLVNLDQTEAERKTKLISDRIESRVAKEFPEAEGRLKPRQSLALLSTGASLPTGSNLSERLLKYLRTVKGEAGPSNRRTPSLERIPFYFSPLWAPSKSMILLNRSIALAPISPHKRMELGRYSRTQIAETDYIALSKTVRSISSMLLHENVSPILVPVHFGTMNGKASSLIYKKLLESVSPTIRMLLALEVVNVPAGQSVGDLLEAAESMKPLVKWISLSLGFGDERIDDLNSELIWSVSTSLQNARSTDGEIFPALQRYQVRASSVKLSTIVHGANSIGLTMAAVRAGITYISGSAVHPVSTVPRALGPHNPALSAISSSRVVRRWKY